MKKQILFGALFLILGANANAGGNTENMCKQAVYLAGGDGGYAQGFCRGTSESAQYWQCIISAISSSGRRGSDPANVIAYARGYGSCR